MLKSQSYSLLKLEIISGDEIHTNKMTAAQLVLLLLLVASPVTWHGSCCCLDSPLFVGQEWAGPERQRGV